MSLIEKDGLFLRPNLDLLFVALNPPNQSNSNGHFFSGKQSLFYKQLYQSGLIITVVDKSVADDLVFGSNRINYKGMQFGVVDLIPQLVETNSRKVKFTKDDVHQLIDKIRENEPRIVCIIHSKVKNEIEKLLNKKLDYGYCGRVIDDCDTEFYCNYFPNGNSISSQKKLSIYELIKEAL